MESYHTGNKFGVGPLNEPHVPNLYPRPLRPGALLTSEKAAQQHEVAQLSLNGKQLIAVFPIKALWRLRCCALAICGVEEREHWAWARELTKLGHEVRLMPAKDVKAYVKRTHQGPQPQRLHSEAGYMAAPERFADTPDSFPLHRGRRPYMAPSGGKHHL